MAPYYDAAMLTEPPPYSSYRVWSQRTRRWLGLTFNEYQAWLTRPDLDPGEFAQDEVAS